MFGRPTGRVPELLENIKTEFETVAHECNVYKMQRDDYERKLQAQITELNSIQNALVELERKHNKLKRHYEDEMVRLQNLQHLPSNDRNAFASRKTEEDHSLPSLLHPRSDTTPSYSFSGSQGLAPISGNLGKRVGPRPGEELPAIHAQQTPKLHKPNEEVVTAPIVAPPSSNGTTTTPKTSQPPTPQPPSQPQLSHNSPDSSSMSIEDDHQAAELPTHVMEDRDIDKDYRIGHNPSVQQKLAINLAYELEHNSVVCCVKFSCDGKYLATGCNRKAQIFAVETGERVHTFTDEAWTGEDLYLRSVCFSPDGRYLACGAEDKTVKVWDIEKETIYHTFDGHTMDIYSVDYSSDGRFIVSGSGDKKARIWDVEKKKCMFTLGTDEVGPKDGVTSVAISPDGRLIAAGSLDRIVRLWDAQTGYFLERYEGHSDSVYSVAFSPDGKSLASGSLDRTLKVWDLSESRSRSRCRSTFSGHTDFVLSVAFSPDGNWLISGSKDRSVQFWDPRTAVTHTKLEGHKNSVISISVNPTNSNGTFATGSGDCRAKVWRYSRS